VAIGHESADDDEFPVDRSRRDLAALHGHGRVALPTDRGATPGDDSEQGGRRQQHRPEMQGTPHGPPEGRRLRELFSSVPGLLHRLLREEAV
jgi:hypothetical protein